MHRNARDERMLRDLPLLELGGRLVLHASDVARALRGCHRDGSGPAKLQLPMALQPLPSASGAPVWLVLLLPTWRALATQLETVVALHLQFERGAELAEKRPWRANARVLDAAGQWMHGHEHAPLLCPLARSFSTGQQPSRRGACGEGAWRVELRALPEVRLFFSTRPGQ